MKKLLLLLLTLLLLPMAVSAQNEVDVDIDGIYYRFDMENGIIIVISHPDKYSGDVVIPSTVSVWGNYFPVVDISDGAFEGCENLQSVTIPHSVTSIGEGAFSGCSSLTSIVVDEENTYYDSRDNCNAIINTTDNMLIAGCKNTVIPSSVTSIGDGAFRECGSLTSITIPSSVKSIGAYAFYGCSSLTSITIPSSVKSIGDGAFAECGSLTSITIPNSVTSIGDETFDGCGGLTSITIPSSVTSIGYGAFRWCNSLLSITIPSSVTSIGGEAFSSCHRLTSVTIGSSVTAIGGGAFNFCIRLASITIPSSVTSIGGGITSDCTSLTSIVVEEGNTQYDSRDNCNAIIDKTNNILVAGCKTTVIPSSVTSIGEKAFWGMPLTSIVIPGSVAALVDLAFANCSALTDVYCLAENAPSATSRDFLGSSYKTATLYVPAGSVEKYKAAAPWKNFGNIEILKCVKPTIASANGKLTFSCETEGVEFVASVSPSGITTYKGSSLLLSDLKTTYHVSVYARKEGYENSEAATIDIDYLPDLDDVNGDGQISISDVVGIVDIILKGN